MSNTHPANIAFRARLAYALLTLLFISFAAPSAAQEYHVLTADEAGVRNGELVSVKIGRKDFERIEVPSEIGGEKVTAIGKGVFERFRMTSVRISEGIKRIGYKAFHNCSLVDISLPDGLEVICDHAFRQSGNDSTIASLTIPASVDSIGASAFSECPIERLILSPGVKYIGEAACHVNSLAQAQDAQVCDYSGDQCIAAKFDGNRLDMDDFSECGLAMGRYGQSSEIVTEFLVRTYSKAGFKETNGGSKLILKVNGENMELTSPLGTCCPAAHISYWGTDGVLGFLGGSETWVFATDAKYPLTKEQLERLLKYGFSKYRLQVEGEVREGELDSKKQKKLTHKLNKAYKKIAGIADKVSDLSDF